MVSPAGPIIAQSSLPHHHQTFLYTHFQQISQIINTYHIRFSLAHRLRPGSIPHPNDEPHFP
ncbi:phosphomethylpyrimidine synthase ThiC, partial [Bacillus velezensis]|uniref:phosphomethylpyrimidine synthase ThiC n=1 Tax=Bacillus velezensis TaxID=492670 RepID=UPI00374EBC3C